LNKPCTGIRWFTSISINAQEDKIAQMVLEHHEESKTNEGNSATIKDTGKAADELLSILTAVLLHPIVTSTVVFLLMDLLGFMQYYVYYGWCQ
jgi:hypothetical protein